MTFDGCFLHSLLIELSTYLNGGYITKIQQPNDLDLLLTLRNKRHNYRLLVSAEAAFPKIYLTTKIYPNPEQASNFCMVLRKYIQGSQIQSITQYENDRIVKLALNKRNDFGDEQLYYLVIELMGRHSNIFLLGQNQKIIECIKHIPMYQNSFRTLLPGAIYRLPPIKTQVNPFKIEKSFSFYDDDNKELTKKISQNFMGIGRRTAEELAYRYRTSNQTLGEVIANFCLALSEPSPFFVSKLNKSEIYPTYYESETSTQIPYPSLSEMVEDYNQISQLGKEANQLHREMVQVLKRIEKHLKKKQQRLEKQKEKIKTANELKIKGEILTTYMFKIKPGTHCIELPNYYDNNRLINIPLDPALNPADNAQKYFKQYAKCKRASSYIHVQLEDIEVEFNYLDSLRVQLQLADIEDLPVIAEEMRQVGYLKNRKKNNINGKRRNRPSLSFREFMTTNGNKILIGRNNKQNDLLTFKHAPKNTYWFHAQNIPGSHVVLLTNTPSEDEIVQAASLAAYFSKYQLATQVPVDYTTIKNVKKPSGSKPGFVNYFNYKTIFVKPTKF